MKETSIPEIILQQLGGRRFALMTGAKNFEAVGLTLQMSLPRNTSGANRLWITYDEGEDLYTMRFFHDSPIRWNSKKAAFTGGQRKEIRTIHSVFCDQLQSIFREITGMETRMPRIVGINA